MQYIMTYFTEYRKNAVEEIKRIDQEAVCERLTWECTVITTQMEDKVFIKRLKESQPVFIRHLMPMVRRCVLTDQRAVDLPLILKGVWEICDLKEGSCFAVQARVVEGKGDYNAKDVEIYLGEYYEERGCLPVFSDDSIINYDIYVISIFIKGRECYIGFSKAEDNLNFHPNEYRVLGKQPREICRAENKLKEAISKFKIKMKGKGYALDVGAAPGGWSKVLADYGYQVFAVDPGEMDERLNQYKNIRHYKARIEELTFEEPFNLVTCDMNVDALIAAKIISELHSKMAEDGECILTLKLPFKDEEKRIKESLRILAEKFDIITVKNLTHNRREVTVYMQCKKQEVLDSFLA